MKKTYSGRLVADRKESIARYEPHATRYKLARGMSLVEAIVWIAMFIAAMLALTTSVLQFYRASSYSIQEATATASAQRGVDSLVQTIREASYASNGAYPIISIAPNEIRFYANTDSDPLIEQVHFYIAGNSLMEGVIQPAGDPPVYTGAETASDISDYVHNVDQNVPIFTYFDKNGTQITDYTRIGDVRFVSLNVMVDVNPVRAPTILTFRSSAALRNLIGH
jgi:hypothetical protein